jgi:uncharacterized protein (TIRG00374 family)
VISEADIKFPDIPFRKTAALILVGLVIYFIYLYLVGFESLRAVLSGVDYRLMALAIAVSLCGNLFHAAGWWVLLRHVRYEISLGWTYLVYLSSIFFTNLIPSAAMSGEVGKIYFIQKSVPGTRVDRTFAAGLMSRLLEVVPVALGAIVGVAYLAMFYSLPAWALGFCVLVAGVISLIATAVLAVSMNPRLLKSMAASAIRVASRVFRRMDVAMLTGRTEALVAQFDASMREIAGGKLLILKSLALIMIAWVFDVSVAYIVFMALGHEVSVGVIITIYSMMVLLQLIPTFLPGGLGIVDAVMTVLYLSAGLPGSIAAGATVMIRLVTLWFLTAVGGLATLFLARATGK